MAFPRSLLALSLVALAGFSASSAAGEPSSDLPLPLARWKIVERESGPVNYYTLYKSAQPPFVRAEYKPSYKTAVLGFQLPDDERSRAKRLRWKWRAITLPNGGNECKDGKGDSAAVVYVTWKRGLRWYTLKYVWSAVGKKGAVCDSKRNPFVAQDTVIVESGGPLNEWKTVNLDLRAEFRNHFENGDANADVPISGIGIMTDGDQTGSISVGDYAEFVISH